MKFISVYILCLYQGTQRSLAKNAQTILRDFRNAPFYIHCLFHTVDLRMFSISFYPLSQWIMICHDFDLLMLFTLT